MQQYNCLGVIPARISSTRLPEKPLCDIAGKSLIQRVYEQCLLTKTLSKIIIATDDNRIVDACKAIRAPVVLTNKEHPSGTDRVAEVLTSENKAGNHYSFVANIQGDLPFIQPELIDLAVQSFSKTSSDIGMGTVAAPLSDYGDFTKSSVVKVVTDRFGKALYFSRSPIPHVRDSNKGSPTVPSCALKHVGLYIYRPETLLSFPRLSKGPLEPYESLEQLRALENGFQIHVAVVPSERLEPGIEVDTEEDLKRAIKFAS